jgi:putative effector of murein hydrolase LrgA (UPF0299 family)
MVIGKEKIGTVCLGIATFLNPFGFDIVVYKLMKLTNDYWHTMGILYVISALLFGLSYISFKKFNYKLGNLLLTIALFFNPFGYDIIVDYINGMTNDYWTTIFIMYILAAFFFLVYLFTTINNKKRIQFNNKIFW